MFVHLQWHSDYSFLESIAKITDIIKTAKNLNHSAIGLTDYNGLYAAIEFYEYCKKSDIKPIIGCEVGFVLHHAQHHHNAQPAYIVLLAQNKEGYYNLIELVSKAQTINSQPFPKISYDDLKMHAWWLIGLVGWLKSVVGQMINKNESPDKIKDMVRMIDDALWWRLYASIVAQPYILQPSLKDINNFLLSLYADKPVHCVTTVDYRYIFPDQKYAYEIALAIKDWKKMYDLDRRKADGEYRLMDRSDVHSILSSNGLSDIQIDQLIDNTLACADTLNVSIDLYGAYFPNYQTPEDIQQIYKHYQQTVEQNESKKSS